MSTCSRSLGHPHNNGSNGPTGRIDWRCRPEFETCCTVHHLAQDGCRPASSLADNEGSTCAYGCFLRKLAGGFSHLRRSPGELSEGLVGGFRMAVGSGRTLDYRVQIRRHARPRKPKVRAEYLAEGLPPLQPRCGRRVVCQVTVVLSRKLPSTGSRVEIWCRWL
jgi:hypothetical protein